MAPTVATQGSTASHPFSGPVDGEAALFTKVRPRRGFEYISEQIREAVASGKLTPGSRLPAERDMAEIFGVSRQGVREALRGLEMSGLIESKPGVSGGAFIRSGDPGVVTRAVNDLASLGALSSESLLEARILLTSDIVRLVCERATESDFEKLEAYIDAFEEQDAQSAAGADRTLRVTHFYSILAEATHNEVLAMLMNSLTEIVQRRLNKVGPEPLTNVTQMRRKLVKHLRAGDADSAVQAMTEHLKRVEHRLIEKEAPLAASKK
ncbi:FadR/GntR family transcriptional regulator [Pseudarthrobacter sp. B4EP4b]|uniref:FadR/GntR family transcriptional regulator n=1 Tax=Pseudarthrobacter sp. B4EP4b TaxID=2590664 RepID=UPI00114EB571|nr:FadR/GntR family transcriptional regulator [Pseudarthrobacter sp. B4EP4b]